MENRIYAVIIAILMSGCVRYNVKSSEEALKLAEMTYEFSDSYCSMPDDVKQTIRENIDKVKADIERIKNAKR